MVVSRPVTKTRQRRSTKFRLSAFSILYLKKKKSEIKKLQSDVDQVEQLSDRKQGNIEKAKDVVKGVVKGAKENN